MMVSRHPTRVDEHPILGPMPPRQEVSFTFDGRRLSAFAGEMVAAALLAHGIRGFRTTERGRAPRGLYCAIGHCFECLVTVDGGPPVRACLTPVRDGMEVTSAAVVPDSVSAAVPPAPAPTVGSDA